VPAYLAALAVLPPMPRGRRLVVGGHSYGGRVASLLVAGVNVSEGGRPPVAGLVCFSYPLHLPGQPEKGLRRPLAAIAVPAHPRGESDPQRISSCAPPCRCSRRRW
jgi:predicted alpha/beta-hydrolase family hydrolase